MAASEGAAGGVPDGGGPVGLTPEGRPDGGAPVGLTPEGLTPDGKLDGGGPELDQISELFRVDCVRRLTDERQTA